MMDSVKMIPLERRADDPLRYGIHGVKSDIIEPHPLETAYRSAKLRQEGMNKKILANTYGAAFPMKMELDRQILSKLLVMVSSNDFIAGPDGSTGFNLEPVVFGPAI